ncbi:dual oxidase maturation factor 1-like [Onthophagus taurus]|uniref:dual oxidase maturation factor 1-like n=1 Tax=Onthophagus taurus TaxID=166361 RepID=UPI000C20C663|nr:dual oxidase maturation factor 1-like [Onthophagus taurus]XP_022920957.1 dual oxidase maturation factor 1-like [Onthophagus taurus]XP_022920958.1 dual oxidase maturation factor 1-like [Onthophagus taurus]
MKGWFDAFRSNGGPTLYSFNNRTAVTGDVTLITFLSIFVTLYVAFLIIFPGIRKQRFTTFLSVTLSLFTGTTILVSLFGSDWHVGENAIHAHYRAFSKDELRANLKVLVGLQHVNVTLRADNSSVDIDFNERFYFYSSCQMYDSYKQALFNGLPYPILTVAEYFLTGQEGLSWGIQYRTAGYFAIIMLWTSFAAWLLMNLMLIVVPRYGTMLMILCGILLVSTNWGYMSLLPKTPLVNHIENSTIQFNFGWCFWLVFIAGCLCLAVGIVISVIELFCPNSFSTILEVDYDTPYDRHIIIEDSKGKRFQKKRNSQGKLEESQFSLGSRILRRLSSKDKDDRSIYEISEPNHIEMKNPRSPWRYSLDHVGYPINNGMFERSCSHRSTSTAESKDLPQLHKQHTRLNPSQDRNNFPSMW